MFGKNVKNNFWFTYNIIFIEEYIVKNGKKKEEKNN